MAEEPKKRKGRTLMLGGHKIRLRYVAKLKDDAFGEDLDGFWEPDKYLISVKGGQTEAATMETIIHECCHAVSDHYYLNLNEKTVTALGHGLAQILKPFLKKI